MKFLNPLFIGGLRKYRLVEVDKITSVMAEAAILNHPGVRIIENEEILAYR